MAIFGAGSLWNSEEQRDKFFSENRFILGWDNRNASDIYSIMSSVKVGGIIYLKANKPGSKEIKVMGS